MSDLDGWGKNGRRGVLRRVRIGRFGRQRLEIGLVFVIVEVGVLDGRAAVRLDADLMDDADTTRAADTDAARRVLTPLRCGERPRHRHQQREARPQRIRPTNEQDVLHDDA